MGDTLLEQGITEQQWQEPWNALKGGPNPCEAVTVPLPVAGSAGSDSLQTDTGGVGGTQGKTTNVIRGSRRINTQKRLNMLKAQLNYHCRGCANTV